MSFIHESVVYNIYPLGYCGAPKENDHIQSYRLDKVLDIEPQDDPENLTVVIVKRGDSQAGLVVDNLIGQQEIVIKSLGKYINGNKLISGATILGDGEIAMIIDTNTLI